MKFKLWLEMAMITVAIVEDIVIRIREELDHYEIFLFSKLNKATGLLQG